MKKLILGTMALIGACSMADANTLFIINNNNCTYDLSIGGIGSSGPTVAVPGASSFSSSTSPATTISGVKLMFLDVTGSTSQIYVGNGTPFANSAGFPAPVCSNQFNMITAIWQVDPAGDVHLTIM